jgi:hypothetical protein
VDQRRSLGTALLPELDSCARFHRRLLEAALAQQDVDQVLSQSDLMPDEIALVRLELRPGRLLLAVVESAEVGEQRA